MPSLRALGVGSIVYAVALSPDGKRAASGSYDGLVRLWDTATGRQLVTLLSIPGKEATNDWLALTPEGYALAGDSVATLSQWRMAGRPLTGDTVWRSLRHAEAVAKAIRGETVPAPTFATEGTENAEKRSVKRTKP